jgi:hypothetical protein
MQDYYGPGGVKVFYLPLKILTNAHFYGLSNRLHYSFFFLFFMNFLLCNRLYLEINYINMKYILLITDCIYDT